MLKLRTHYYQQFDTDDTRDVPEEGYGGWKTGTVEIDPQRTAVALMHAWDCGTAEQFPGWFRACGWIPRAAKICREVMPGLLAAVRSSGMNLFHVVPESHYYQRYPGYQRTLALAGPPPPPPPQVDPDPTFQQLKQFRADCGFVGQHNQADVDRGFARLDFAKGTEPQGDEFIAKDGHQLFAVCRHTGVNHLIYAGFAIDWCLLMSPGGMVDMGRHGVICSAFRDAVTAVENKESARGERGKDISLWRVSVGFGFVFDTADFVAAVRSTHDRGQR